MNGRLRPSRSLLIGGGLVGVIVGAAIFAGLLTPIDPLAQDLAHRLQEPTGLGTPHWLGTDELGRDIWSRLLHGARLSLIVAGVAVLVAAVVGVTLGLVAGYFGGWAETLVLQATDIQLALPSILLAIVVASVVGTSITNLILVLAVSGWVIFTRIVHSTTVTLKSREFVTAAKSIGATPWRIVWRHILPNSWTPVVVITATQFARMMLTEASLSFLGLGIQQPAPAWGSMLNDSRLYLLLAPYLAIFPGAAIVLTVFAINMFGDALRQALDPRLRQA